MVSSIFPDDPPDTKPFVMSFDPPFPCDKNFLSCCKSLTGFLGKLQAAMACFKASSERGHGEVYAGVAYK